MPQVCGILDLLTQIIGQRRRISLPVRGAGYELLIPFRGYSAELKRERNQRSLSRRPHAGAESSAEFSRRQYLNPLSFRHARRRQGSTSQNTNTYCILRTRAEGIQPPAEAGPRTLPDRSLDRVVEGRIGLEKEAYGRLARGMWMVVALCAHLNNSENERHKEIFPYRQLLTRSFWYCAFVHAPGLWP